MRDGDNYWKLGGSLGTVACWRAMIQALRPYESKFRFLTITNGYDDMKAEAISAAIDNLKNVLQVYDDWESACFTLPTDTAQTLEKSVTDLYMHREIWSPNHCPPNRDVRDFLNLDLLETQVVPKLLAAMLALQKISDRAIYKVVESEIAFNAACLGAVLYSAINLFLYEGKENQIPANEIKELQDMIGFEELPILKLHAEQQVFNQEERYAQEHAAELEARREEEERELAAAREAVKEHASAILASYNELKDSNAIRNFRFSDNVVKILQTPDSADDCDHIESLYKFLLALPNDIHYLPGEAMQPEDVKDRLNWAFTDLDTEIIKHGTMVTVMTKTFGLMEPNIAQALLLLNDGEEDVLKKIVAQYTESKEYIEDVEAPVTKPGPIPLAVSVFLMR